MQHVWHTLDRTRRLAIRTRDLGGKLLGVLLQQGVEGTLGERLTYLKREILKGCDVRIRLEGLVRAGTPGDNFPPSLCQFE